MIGDPSTQTPGISAPVSGGGYYTDPASISGYQNSNIGPQLGYQNQGANSYIDSITGMNNGAVDTNDPLSFLKKAGNGDYGSLQGWGSVLGGAGQIFSAWNGYQQLKQAKKEFGANMAFANRNLANQSTVVNQQLRDRRGGRRAAFGGNAGPGAQVDGSAVV